MAKRIEFKKKNKTTLVMCLSSLKLINLIKRKDIDIYIYMSDDKNRIVNVYSFIL